MSEAAPARVAAWEAVELADRAIDRASGNRSVPGNRVALQIDGPDTYRAMLALIEAARHQIHFENYIIRDDSTGRAFADALSARARAGVAVRVLYDWLGSIATRGRYWKSIAAAGAEVHGFNPPHLIDLFRNLSRDHRKLLTVDGRFGVLGGLCIGDEWMGDASRGIQPWRDTAVEIEGPVVTQLDQAFARVWRRTGGTPFDVVAGDLPGAGNAGVRVLAGAPGRERTYRVIELLAAGCAERLWVTDAYMVPPPRLFQGLLDAARDGADVRLLVPGTSDLPWIWKMCRLWFRDIVW